MENSEKRILDKIRKLLAKAKDPAASEAEVEIFMKKAQDLMMRYDLEESSIEIHPSDINKDVITSDLYKYFKFKYKNFEWELLDTIGPFYNCRIYDKTFGKEHRLSIVGRENDRLVVSEMYQTLSLKFLSLVDLRYKEYKERVKVDHSNKMIAAGLKPTGIDIKSLERIGVMQRKPVFAGSYLSGCIDGLRQALGEQKEDTLKLIDSEAYGLMVVNLKSLIDTRVPELMGKVRKVDGIGKSIKIDRDAYEEGVKDGKSNHTNKMLTN